MELLGFFVPVWALVLSYVLGMPLLGYPLGKWSIRVWKHPEHFPTLGKILFPFNATSGSIGKLEDDGEGGNNLPPTMDMFGVHYALEQGVRLPIAHYLVMQMLCWPARVIFTVVYCTVFFVLQLLVCSFRYAAKLLLRCKECVEI